MKIILLVRFLISLVQCPKNSRITHAKFEGLMALCFIIVQNGVLNLKKITESFDYF